MHAVSAVGSAGFLLPVMAVVYWSVCARAGARGALLLGGSMVVNGALKLLFHDPRPYWTDPSIPGRQPLESFGMPSGHAQNSAVGWGYLASLGRRRWIWAGAAPLVVLIGVSRVQLGAHSPGQVLAGLAVGVVLLAAALRAEPYVVPWWTRQRRAAQVGLSLAVSLTGLAATWAALRTLDGWMWPATWRHEILAAGGNAEPVTLEDGAAAAGTLFGLLAGLSLIQGRFAVAGTAWQRAARVPVGGAGALIVYTVGLFLGTQPFQTFVVQALIGLWIAAGAPEAFVRLGLAGRPTPVLTRPGEEREPVRP